MELIAEGVVPWRKRRLEIELIVASVIAMPIALVVAIYLGQPSWFQRASALPLITSAMLAYRCLIRSYEKTRNAHLRLVKFLQNPKDGPLPVWIKTSATQKALDHWTLWLLVVGTVMASFGDVIVELITP